MSYHRSGRACGYRRPISLFRRRQRSGELHVADPRFDDWPPVADYEDLPTARAFVAQLRDLGVPAELTADWPLDAAGRGDIALRVPPDRYGDATVILDGLDDE